MLIFFNLSQRAFCYLLPHFKFLNPSMEICVLEELWLCPPYPAIPQSHTHSYNSKMARSQCLSLYTEGKGPVGIQFNQSGPLIQDPSLLTLSILLFIFYQTSSFGSSHSPQLPPRVGRRGRGHLWRDKFSL